MLSNGVFVRTRTGALGIVVAHSTISGRVIVSVWNGWCWLVGRGMDVDSLTVIEAVAVAEAA